MKTELSVLVSFRGKAYDPLDQVSGSSFDRGLLEPARFNVHCVLQCVTVIHLALPSPAVPSSAVPFKHGPQGCGWESVTPLRLLEWKHSTAATAVGSVAVFLPCPQLQVTPSLLFNLTDGKPYVIGSQQKQSNQWVPSTQFFVGKKDYFANFMVQVGPRLELPANRMVKQRQPQSRTLQHTQP